MPAIATELTPEIRQRIVYALIKCDERQSAGRSPNPYAMGHYLRALHNAESDMADGGSTLAQALYDSYCGRVLSAVERAAGLPLTYGGGGHDRGRPDY